LRGVHGEAEKAQGVRSGIYMVTEIKHFGNWG
jgi:hypothetical protein